MSTDGHFAVTLFGLGEAGSLFAADLATAGVDLRGYDPAPVDSPKGLVRYDDPREAVAGTDVVLGLVAEHDMVTAVTQAADRIPGDAIYADCGAGSPGVKRQLATVAADHGFSFVDVGLMAIVPGNGIATPALASGDEAERFVAEMTPLGMRVTAIEGGVGEASARKLLRSVVVKGLSTLILESLRAAELAGNRDWVWQNIVDQIESADRDFLVRLIEGTGIHSVRRTDEMIAASNMLAELGVDPRMTRGTVEVLRTVPEEGLPSVD